MSSLFNINKVFCLLSLWYKAHDQSSTFAYSLLKPFLLILFYVGSGWFVMMQSRGADGYALLHVENELLWTAAPRGDVSFKTLMLFFLFSLKPFSEQSSRDVRSKPWQLHWHLDVCAGGGPLKLQQMDYYIWSLDPCDDFGSFVGFITRLDCFHCGAIPHFLGFSCILCIESGTHLMHSGIK